MAKAGRPKLPEQMQTMIWTDSKTCTIGQIAKRYGIDKGTVKKYGNPQYL